MELVKGHRGRVDQLTSATTLELGVTLAGPSTYDVSLFALDAAGRLSDDAYLVFYNQPASPEGSLRVAARADGGDFTVDLAAVPAWIHRLVLTVAIDGAGTMAQLAQGQHRGPGRWPGGRPPHHHRGRLRRRAGADARSSSTARTSGRLTRPAWRSPSWTRASTGAWPPWSATSAARSTTRRPPPPPAAARRLRPRPAARAAGEPGQGHARQGPGLAGQEPDRLAGQGRASRCSSQVAMGLGWDPARAGTSIDLDASCLVLRRQRREDRHGLVRRQGPGAGGAIVHSGDNLTGEGEGDDEVITVDLGQVPPAADVLLFTVNSYKRHPFTEVINAYCRLFDLGTGEELVHFALTGSEPRTGVFMAALFRSGAGWDMTALGVFQDGRTVREMVGPAKAVLATLDARERVGR